MPRNLYPWSCQTASGMHRYRLRCGAVVTLRFEVDRSKCDEEGDHCGDAEAFEVCTCIDCGDHAGTKELTGAAAGPPS